LIYRTTTTNGELSDNDDNRSVQPNAPIQSKVRGKRRAIVSDSDDDLESPYELLASPPTSPNLSVQSAAELPPTERASSSMASIAEPSDASEGSGFDRGLADSGSPMVPSNVQLISLDTSEPSTSRRSKRVRIERHIGAQLEDDSCSEDSCDNPTDPRPMVTCAGPGCSMMVGDVPAIDEGY
jgi:hypothetical protein